MSLLVFSLPADLQIYQKSISEAGIEAYVSNLEDAGVFDSPGAVFEEGLEERPDDGGEGVLVVDLEDD